jgi:uncharacterized protein YbjT (DUF2867 family)
MNLLVIGATGGTGRELVAQALARGHQVTGMARRVPKEPQRAGLTWISGDVRRPESLEQAMAGQEAVLLALGHKRWLGPSRILSEGTRNVIDAMERHDVRRLICETALGISESWWQMGAYYILFVRPVILPFYFWDKVRQEAVIKASSLDWTIVRPGALTNGPRRGRYRQGPRVGHWLWTVRIARADVAAFMLDQLTDIRYLRATVGIAD